MICELEKSGVHLSLSPSGELKAEGDPEGIKKCLPLIREHKTVLIAELRDRQEKKESSWWRVRFQNGGTLEVFTPSGDTRASILARVSKIGSDR